MHEMHFDSVFVIDSLSPIDAPTGKTLYNQVLKPHEKLLPEFSAHYHEAHDKKSLLKELDALKAYVMTGAIPILHIESHGTADGIRTASGEIIPWKDLREPLTAINEATNFNLLVVMAMCYGGYLARVLRPPSPSPAWATIGPDELVGSTSLYRGMSDHYTALLSQQNGTLALQALNTAQANAKWRYYFRSAEDLFHEAVKHFFENRPREVVKDHENQIVADYIKDRGGDITLSMLAREHATRKLSDERYWYDIWRSSFLMLDSFPNNAPRFTKTYEDYWTATRPSGMP